eukprot:CAMPEP_0196581686 /NCGR_PEP_ID=MMETSP1081-20130531/35044_1 /TAXON_ID=36882 /ORGANISM="Pyramimonas amylifera, Strain CCMP720" /LENGTH=199 /DNA_ID=CAMNT_0041902009 /DNA_START=229 /DNA_END=828 /DNA_ORIENTATION=+
MSVPEVSYCPQATGDSEGSEAGTSEAAPPGPSNSFAKTGSQANSPNDNKNNPIPHVNIKQDDSQGAAHPASQSDAVQAQPPHSSMTVGPSQTMYWAGQPTMPFQPMATQHQQMVRQSFLQQDEREVKRQRRKQSNRESARRSRLRKQAECEDLSNRLDHLDKENKSLRSEIDHLNTACSTLRDHKAQLQNQLKNLQEAS